MVQLQISITFENQKVMIDCNKLSREDAGAREMEMAQHLEKMIEGILISAAKEAGMGVKERRVRKAKVAK